MIRKRRLLLAALVLAAAPLAGFLFGYFREEYAFDDIWTPGPFTLPAQDKRELYIIYPGPTWDDPDPPPSRSQSYHAVLNLMRSQKYRKSLLPSPMEDGGTVIYLHQGCTPSIVAYWSGGKLWLADENEAWTAYIPSNPGKFREELETLLKRYG